MTCLSNPLKVTLFSSFLITDDEPGNLDRSNRSPYADGNDSEQALPSEEKENTTETL